MSTRTDELCESFNGNVGRKRKKHWNSLDDLRATALAAGCTPALFAEAIETVGDDPHRVANYLQRYALSWRLPEDGDRNAQRIS